VQVVRRHEVDEIDVRALDRRAPARPHRAALGCWRRTSGRGHLTPSA
jgi:hypothetical protein